MRLDKYIADNSPFSRADTRKLIKAGRVSINRVEARHSSQHLLDEDIVHIDGRTLQPVGQLYIVINKPAGYVCANTDAEHPTIIDLISEPSRFIGSDEDYQRIRAATLQIVGRLDIDTTGLLFLTNDGQWNHSITSPKSVCKKTYVADLSEPLSQVTVDAFKAGILLRNEDKPTASATLEILHLNKARVTVSEGRYHQVKRMFAACGNKVLRLHRERIGDYNLDCNLGEGHFRLLSPDERV